MKTIYALLIVLLISHYKSEKCTSNTKPNKATDCLERDLDGDEYICCQMNNYFKDNTSDTYCVSLEKKQFEDLKGYMKEVINKNGGSDNYKEATIDCSSNYAFVSILSLILLFL